jgi:hypothetical protein
MSSAARALDFKLRQLSPKAIPPVKGEIFILRVDARIRVGTL